VKNPNAWKSPGRPDFERCEKCGITRPVTVMQKFIVVKRGDTIPLTVDVDRPSFWACKDLRACLTDLAALTQPTHVAVEADAMLEAHASAPSPPSRRK